MQPPLPIAAWAGRRIDPAAEPWYRFGRVLATLDKCTTVPPGAKWLDVGCQMGQFLKVVAAKYGAAPAGIDDFVENDAVEVCRKYLRLVIDRPSDIFDGSWRYFTRRIDQTGFALNEKFDFVSALEVLEHMVDTDAFIDECRNHLASDGWLIISTPNINSLRNRIAVPLGRYPAALEYRTLVHHVRLYNAGILKEHIESHGFKLQRMAGTSFLPRHLARGSVARRIDVGLSETTPQLCGDLIAVFRRID